MTDNQLYCVFLQTLYFRPSLVLLLKKKLYFCAQNVIILNMRRSISFTILFFVMLSVLVSCYQSHKRELDLAYTLAESKPDSALPFLNRINQGKLSDKDMAKYALIYYMAQDKSGLDVDNDSLIRIAYDWYGEHQDDSLYATTLYYMGKCFLLNDSMEAYSRTIWPLFVWHLLFYIRHRKMSMHFDMAEFDKVIVLPSVRIQDPQQAINYLAKKVRAKLFQLERRFKTFKDELPDMIQYQNRSRVGFVFYHKKRSPLCFTPYYIYKETKKDEDRAYSRY